MENILKNFFAGDMRVINDHKYEKDNLKNIDVKNFLKNIPIFSGLDDYTIELVFNSGMQKNYKKGKVILFENEAGSAIYIIIKGQLKVSRIDENGREVILTILKETDFFGEMSVLDESERSASIIAMEDTLLFVIQSNEFHKLIRDHSEISLALIKEMIQRIRRADTKIKSLSLSNSEGKVASVIIELVNSAGVIDNNMAMIENVPYQHDLANMGGTSRETISRTLSKFVKRGLIEFDGQKMIIADYNNFKETFEV